MMYFLKSKNKHTQMNGTCVRMEPTHIIRYFKDWFYNKSILNNFKSIIIYLI